MFHFLNFLFKNFLKLSLTTTKFKKLFFEILVYYLFRIIRHQFFSMSDLKKLPCGCDKEFLCLEKNNFFLNIYICKLKII